MNWIKKKVWYFLYPKAERARFFLACCKTSKVPRILRVYAQNCIILQNILRCAALHWTEVWTQMFLNITFSGTVQSVLIHHLNNAKHFRMMTKKSNLWGNSPWVNFTFDFCINNERMQQDNYWLFKQKIAVAHWSSSMEVDDKNRESEIAQSRAKVTFHRFLRRL